MGFNIVAHVTVLLLCSYSQEEMECFYLFQQSELDWKVSDSNIQPLWAGKLTVLSSKKPRCVTKPAASLSADNSPEGPVRYREDRGVLSISSHPTLSHQ